MKNVWIFIFGFLICGSVLNAQTRDQSTTSDSSTETIVVNDTPTSDSTRIVENSFFQLFRGKPGKAALYGLIFPGGGQIYNRRWWKVPLAYAAEGALVWRIVESTREYNEAQEFLIANLNGESLLYKGQTSDVNKIRNERDRFRKAREYAWVFFIGGRLIVVFEAFIDRHLMDFDVSDDLSFKIMPSEIGSFTALSYTIPLDRREKVVFKNLLD